MFLLLGSPRSGTTLLAQLLNAHTDILVPNETDIIPGIAYVFSCIHDKNLGKNVIKSFVNGSNLSRSSFEEYIAIDEILDVIDTSDYSIDMVIAIYKAMAKKQNKVFAGDKSPNNLLNIRYLDLIGFLNGSVKIIHLVRDIRDVSKSLELTSWGKGLLEIFPRIWCCTNMYLSTACTNKESYLFVKYESLVENPDSELKKIFNFLGTEFQKDIIDPRNRSQRYKYSQDHYNIYNEINSTSVGGYKNYFNYDQVQLIEKQAMEAIELYGY